jgi:ribosomal protein S8
MDNAFLESLPTIKTRLDEFSSLTEKDLENFSKHLYSLRERAEKLSDSWSGSWAGFHSFLYYQDFQKPSLQESFDVEWGSINGFSESWQQRSFEDVKQKIEQGIVKTNFDYIFEKVKPLVKQAELLRNYITTELSFVKSDKSLDDEAKLIKLIEEIKFGTSADLFVRNLQPSQVITRDSRAASQGLKVPPHVKYQAQVMAVLSMISDIEKFISIAKQLTRQLEIKFQLSSQGQGVIDSLVAIKTLCNGFHSLARQLRSRHNNRSTLEVEDEYDVQDLLHALLRLYFNDIRKEEWVPSYAGSSSRTDFLLKKEKIVIETKKTSEKLKDKQLGEQIILDVAKYKEHPDCRTLVCFIYDPEGRVSNPSGLEADLVKLSGKDLAVIVIIRPKD